MADITKLPMLKKDAKLEIGTVFIEQLQLVLLYLCEGIDVKKVEQKSINKESLSEHEQSVVIVISLLKGLYKKAEEQGDIYYKELSV